MGNTFVAKMNDTQLNDVSNQSQIFFVNMPQQEQKTQQQQPQQVLPVTVVQQGKINRILYFLFIEYIIINS
jgi:hypothetical protein